MQKRTIDLFGIFVLGLLFIAGMLVPLPARADTLELSLQLPSSVSAGAVGDSFTVVLTDTGGSGVTIGGFDFELESSSADVTLTDANTSTTGTYIFSGGSSLADLLTGGDLTIQTSPLIANDESLSGGTSLTAGESVDLGQVFFNVSSTAPTESVGIDFLSAFTDLSDPTGAAIAIDSMTGGTLNIVGATTAVPEPSSYIMLLSGLLITAFVGMRTRLKGKQKSSELKPLIL